MKNLRIVVHNRSLSFQLEEPIDESFVRMLLAIAGAANHDNTVSGGGLFEMVDRRTPRQVAAARRREWNAAHPRLTRPLTLKEMLKLRKSSRR